MGGVVRAVRRPGGSAEQRQGLILNRLDVTVRETAQVAGLPVSRLIIPRMVRILLSGGCRSDTF
ncbi:MAG: hypothetical protein IRY92_11980 [Dactylosporangium sp.]|nr:hypothetical protein [Dactylosporangium sp.]